MIKVLFLLIFIVNISKAQEALKLGMEDSWPPYAIADGTGYSAEIVKAICDQIKINCKIQVYPYARVVSLVEKGFIDGGFNITKQKSTEENFVFGKNPILKATSYIYYRDNTSKYRDLKALPDKFKIGVIRSYEYGDLFEKEKKRFNLTYVSHQRQLITMLLQKKIDGILLYEKVKEYSIKKMNLNQNQLYKGFATNTSQAYVAFLKNDKSKKLAKKFDEGLSAIKKNGRYQKIFNEFSY